MTGVRGFLRMMRASHLFGNASKLVRRERYQEACDVLKVALDLLQPVHGTLLDPLRLSTRMSAIALLSRAAAKLGHLPLATASIREGLALWEESGLPRTPKLQAMVEWETWARQYLAWANRGEEP